MYEHADTLDAFNTNAPISEKIDSIRTLLRARYGFLDHIAIALFEVESQRLKTFVSSDEGGPTPLAQYEIPLDEVHSLTEMAAKRRPRIINDLAVFGAGKHLHTRRIVQAGFGASYTLPMYHNEVLYGFLFFNSMQKNVFHQGVLYDLDVFGHLISLLAINELNTLRTVVNSINLARLITQYRDRETGTHLQRMAQYTKIIASAIATKFQLDDEYIQIVFLAAPLHDVGKIATPDHILLKPGPLTTEEMRIMRQHVKTGREIIDVIVQTFSLNIIKYTNILRNIAEYHHEAVNGAGYLKGLKNTEIPLEARIVAVADTFDALTSRRPYKPAWSNAEALAILKRLAGTAFDRDCVDALVQNQARIEEIQRRVKEDIFG